MPMSISSPLPSTSCRHGSPPSTTEHPKLGRTVEKVLRIPIIARETADEAWARVERQLRESDSAALEIDRGGILWSGFDRIGYEHSIGLVGSYEEVAQRLSSYRDIGVDGFVLSGRPHIEELHRAGRASPAPGRSRGSDPQGREGHHRREGHRMSIDFYWRIGMEGDHASLRTPRRYNRGDAGGYGPGNIAPAIRGGELDGYSYIDHMAAVAKASESAGFLGGLLPSFPMTEDPWATAAALAAETTTYRFMVAFQPGFLHPVQAARMSGQSAARNRWTSGLQHHQRRRWSASAVVGRQGRPRRSLHQDVRVPRCPQRCVGR